MDLRESIRNQTDVSFTLAKHESKDSNLVFSPLSIHVVLRLIASGSKGPTQAQLLSFFNSKSTDELNSLSSQLVSLVFADGGPSGGPRLPFANGVWVDQSLSLKPSFKQAVDTVYKAASSHVDFQTKLQKAAKLLDSGAVRATRFHWQYPTARLLLLFYLDGEIRTCNFECAPDGSNFSELNKEWEDDFWA